MAHHPPSQISLATPAAEHALRELARDGSSGHFASSVEEPLLSTGETSPSFGDAQGNDRAEGIDQSGIVDESFDCNFQGIIARNTRPRFAFQSSLGTSINKRPFYRATSEPTNPHNTPASSSDDSSDDGSVRHHDGGDGRTLSASETSRCTVGCPQWVDPSYATERSPKMSSVRMQPPFSEVGPDVLSPKTKVFGDHQRLANNEVNVEDETTSPGGSPSESSPSRTIGSPHVRFADHSVKRRTVSNSPCRRKKPLWRPVSLHQRHPRRVSYRSPPRTYQISVSRPESPSSAGGLPITQLPLPECYRREDSTNANITPYQDPGINSSAGSPLASSNKSDDDVILRFQTDNAIQDRNEVAMVSVSLHKSYDSIWASPSGLWTIHMRINWSIVRWTRIARQPQHPSRAYHMDGASNIGQIRFTIPVRLLETIRAVTIAARNVFFARATSTVLKLAASVTSFVIASAFWLVGRFWIDTSQFRLMIDAGEH